MRCPVCESEGREVFRVAGGVAVLHCDGCTHRYAGLPAGPDHAAAVYDDDYFFNGGDGYPDYLAMGGLISQHAAQYLAVLAKHAPELTGLAARNGLSRTPSVLEVGAAAGFTMRPWVESRWRVVGVEPNDTVARHGREALGYDVRTGALERVETGEAFDVVSMLQVLPHFYDLHAAMDRAVAATRPGGYWLIETWDWHGWPARLAGRRWHEYSPPSVLQYFSRASLGALARRRGLEVVAWGRPRKRITASHARSLVTHKFGKLAGAAAGVVPGRVVLPYPAGDLMWVLMRRPVG